MKFAVRILPREVVLDTQGRAVEQLLKNSQFKLNSCRVGKYIEVELSSTCTEQEALLEIKKMADFVLYNPLIETYQVERIS